MSHRRRPVIGLPADRRMIGLHPFHAVGEKYINAVVEAADAVPLLIPSLGAALDLDEVLEHVDGILFTGSPSMWSRIITRVRRARQAPCTTRTAMPRHCRSSRRLSPPECPCSVSAAVSRR